jgi:2-haloacid dehalogenase
VTLAKTQQDVRPRIVVFDFGGVLLDWNPRHLYRKMFSDPALMEWFLAEVCSPAWNLAQDGGRPWADAEIEAIARHPDYAREIRSYRKRWHEMISGPIDGTVSLLKDLSAQDVPLYGITNFASDTCRETFERFPFFALFRGVVISGDERLLKPDPRIFKLFGDRYDIDPADCVFIDDVPGNCEAARDCGFHAIDFTTPEQVRSHLVDLGILRQTT